MLTEINIVDINEILKLCSVPRMSTGEIDYLNAIDTTITDTCDNYKTAQSVILDRLRNETCSRGVLARLNRLSEANGCSLQERQVEKPPATIMFIGGGI